MVTTDINDMPVADRIKQWRKHGRRWARAAHGAWKRGDEAPPEEMAAAAAMAAMYFALALDAEHFGDLPELEEDQ